MAKPAQVKNQPITPKVHHYIRTTVSSFFGIVAVTLLLISILVFWVSQTVTNTDQYVKTVGPLVSKPEVQNFVSDKITDLILGDVNMEPKNHQPQNGPNQSNQNDNEGVPVRDLASQLLPAEQVAGKTDEQLKAEIKPAIIAEASWRRIATMTTPSTLRKPPNFTDGKWSEK